MAKKGYRTKQVEVTVEQFDAKEKPRREDIIETGKDYFTIHGSLVGSQKHYQRISHDDYIIIYPNGLRTVLTPEQFDTWIEEVK